VIDLLTLFLGLVVGPQPVELAVSGGETPGGTAHEVAGIELWLDGERVGEIPGPPWIATVDFGRDLVPHELVAVARDEEDDEVDRARLWVNVPRPVVDARIVFGTPAPGGTGAFTPPGSASVVWEAVDLPPPESWAVRLDGEELRVTDLDRFELPPVDPETLHFLTVRLDFGDGVQARAEASFGGIYSDFVSAELTAVAVRRRQEPQGRGGRLDGPEDLAGWFLDERGREIPVVALDRRPPSNVVLVIDPAAQEPLYSLALIMGKRRRRAVLQRLGLDDRVIYLRPGAERVAGERQVFDAFRPLVYPLAERRMDFVQVVTLALAGENEDLSHHPRRLADAVAVAGMLAAEGRRSRAVVLVVGGGGGDSRLLPEQARGYLRALGVPLYVWRAATREEAKEGLSELPEWPEARPLVRHQDFIERVGEVRDDLDAQRVVWLDGTHLQRNLSLSDEARAVVEWP